MDSTNCGLKFCDWLNSWMENHWMKITDCPMSFYIKGLSSLGLWFVRKVLEQYTPPPQRYWGKIVHGIIQQVTIKSGFFHWVYFQGSSCCTVNHCFISLCVCMDISVFIYTFIIGRHLSFSCWLLWIMLLWTFMYRFLHGHVFVSLGYISLISLGYSQNSPSHWVAKSQTR